MQDYFGREITNIERELRLLKTSAIKSGTVVSCAARSIGYSVQLKLTSPTNATGSVRYLLTLNENAIFTATLDKYYDNITLGALGNTRRRDVESYCLSSGIYALQVSAWGDSNDRDTLAGGGAVTISGLLTVTCTDIFTLEEIANE